MGDRFQAEMTSSVRSALRHLTDTQKVIRLDSVKAVAGRGGRGQTVISWTDLTTGKADQVTI
jgi:hypothetical protein